MQPLPPYEKNDIICLASYRARISGHKIAVENYDTGKSYTYSDLNERAEKLASFLTLELNLKKGDIIAICSENHEIFFDAFGASLKTGIIITTYNCLLGQKDLLYLVNHETPKAFFYSSSAAANEKIENLRPYCGDTPFICINGEGHLSDRYHYEKDVLTYRVTGRVPIEHINMEDPQMLIHTGGTTGAPKAATISYRAIYYNTLSEIMTFGLTGADSAYVFLPLFHTAAWNVLTLPLLMVGGSVIITAAYKTETALQIIRDKKPTTAMSVETIYKAMADHPDFENTDFSGYRWMISGAAPISKATLERYWSREIRLFNAYGMTEIGPSNIAPPVNEISIDRAREKWNSAGIPMYFNRFRIVDENGEVLPPGQVGEIIAKSPLGFSGYWKDESQTELIMMDGWIRTGDLGYVDEDGYYYICGRRKNMFISGGENIFPSEIESVLASHPAVSASAVIGVPDEHWGEVGKAIVVPSPDETASAEDLQAYLLQELSKIKVPKYYQFVDSLPVNSVGKIDTVALKEHYGACERSI